MTLIDSIARKLLTIVLVIFSSHAYPIKACATVTEYTNRTDFENAIFNSTLFDFEDQPGGRETNLGDSVDFGEATISTDLNGGGVWSTDAFGAPSIQIAQLNGTNLRVELNPGFTALGMDIGDIQGQRVHELVLKGPSGTLLNISRTVTDNNNLGTVDTTFFGFISDSDEIRSLNMPFSGGFAAIDNLIYGNRRVPEPSTLCLCLLMGIGGAFNVRRRRKNH